jgi:hypothetical protein
VVQGRGGADEVMKEVVAARSPPPQLAAGPAFIVWWPSAVEPHPDHHGSGMDERSAR